MNYLPIFMSLQTNKQNKIHCIKRFDPEEDCCPVILYQLTGPNRLGEVGRPTTPQLLFWGQYLNQGQWQDPYSNTSPTVNAFCDEKERDKTAVREQGQPGV